ncbi:MAG: DUF6485 family protein [Candidatus Margulisbacteria bacterium]|nr:DUF6485 family protein [Candidatus Margulisiibacteriota bacterium]
MSCENQNKNTTRCNCTYPGCSRHGICCECLAYHRRNSELPACCFSEKAEATFDRSIEFFIQQNSS